MFESEERVWFVFVHKNTRKAQGKILSAGKGNGCCAKGTEIGVLCCKQFQHVFHDFKTSWITCYVMCVSAWLCATPHETATPLVTPSCNCHAITTDSNITLLLLLLFFHPHHALNVILLLLLRTVSSLLALD